MTEAKQPEALRLADEQESILLDVANGKLKPAKMPIEPFVRGYAELRRLEAQAALHSQELRAYRLTVENLEGVNKASWISVAESLPPPFEEVIIYPRPSDYCCEGHVNTQGQWSYSEYETGFGHHSIKCEVTHWMAMPASPVAIARATGEAA